MKEGYGLATFAILLGLCAGLLIGYAIGYERGRSDQISTYELRQTLR